MAVYSCKMCGSPLKIDLSKSLTICDFCGSTQTFSRTRDEVISNLLEKANRLRRSSEFDRAEELYNVIEGMDSTDSEGHWGKCLCRFGIEYVSDPATGRMVPTCHRTVLTSILEDEAYQLAVENAVPENQTFLMAEAREIDEIQKKILGVVRNEKPYDVFICYKQTDEKGERTEDSKIAEGIYEMLEANGLHTFFAEKTLERKLGKEFEPYIFAALNTAKVMLVIGTKKENMEAVWVKNEWQRFMKLIREDDSRLLIPCYCNMKVYEMPEAFIRYQAQCLDDISERDHLLEIIREAMKRKGSKYLLEEKLDYGFKLASKYKFVDAHEVAFDVVSVDPQNGRAYLLLLMTDIRSPLPGTLSDAQTDFSDNPNFKMILKYGDAELVSKVKAADEYFRLKKKQDVYNAAKNARARGDFKEATHLFESLGEYQDSQKQAKMSKWMPEIIGGTVTVILLIVFAFLFNLH